MIKFAQKPLEGYKCIDLFAGLGGFRLAMESMGAECVFSSEWDKQAQKVYAKNFGHMPHGDITLVEAASIPDHDILCAGFPCQAFSISGRRRGFADSRGTLFFEVARIVEEKRPRVVFLENVKNFATHDGGRTLAVVQAAMESLGYEGSHSVLSALDFGIPQRRERIFLVYFRKGESRRPFSFPKPLERRRHVEDILLEEGAETVPLYVDREDMVLEAEDGAYSASRAIRLGYVNKCGQGERIYSVKGIAVTLSAYGGGVFAKTGGYLIGGRPRRLHPRECARLMGYPDSFALAESRNQAYQQLGNSVVVDVLQYICIQIAISLGIYPE